ncbi:hypothetical protein ACIRVF_25450 [Kitasatospora sp. NPDC101157]|uniref:hypothetical protein n=1 Tax=Kitasatospora sp. NPDC101157 TaxID=3364098 RepID=UPI00382BC680
MRPEAAEPRGPVPGADGARGPVAVLPLWRRGEDAEEGREADRPGVPRGHPGPAASGQPGAVPDGA